jgi:hypothetical protein
LVILLLGSPLDPTFENRLTIGAVYELGFLKDNHPNAQICGRLHNGFVHHKLNYANEVFVLNGQSEFGKPGKIE